MKYKIMMNSMSILFSGDGGAPVPPPSLSGAAVQSMRQYNSGGGGGSDGGGQGPQPDEDGFSVLGGQVPTPWPGQEESAACCEGDNPQKENFCGPRDNGGLSAIVDLEGSNPIRDLTGGLLDSVMHAFQEALHFGKAAILKFISGTRMTGWLFGSFLRGFLKLFKQFRNHFLAISASAGAKFTAMVSRWFEELASRFGAKGEEEETKSSLLKDHTDDVREKSQFADFKSAQEGEGRRQVDEMLTPLDRETLNKMRVDQALDGDFGKMSPFGRQGQEGNTWNMSQEELERRAESGDPLGPSAAEMRRRRKMALYGRWAGG